MTPKLYRNLLIGAAMVVGLLAFFSDSVRGVFDPKYKLVTDAPRVNAVGATFALTKIEWVPYFGQWEVRSNAVVTAFKPGRKSVSYKEALNGICGALLTQMLFAPDAVTHRSGVFRVSLNFWETENGRLSDNFVFETPFTMPVVEGACPPRSSIDKMVLTYPEPLENWKLLMFAGDLIGDNESDVSAHFVWLGAGPPPVDSFDFDAACKVLLKDAPRFRNEGPVQSGSNLAVLAGRGGSFAGVAASLGTYVEYLIQGDACVRIGEGELS